MRYSLLFMAVLILSGCTSRTEFGECVGVADEKKPDLVYKLDAWNVFYGVLFSQTIIVPIVVLANETLCPVARKTIK